MTISQHDGAGTPAQRTVLFGALGAVGAAATMSALAGPARAAQPSGLQVPAQPAAGTASGYLWPDRTPVIPTDLSVYAAAETRGYSYVVDKGLPAVNSFTAGAVLPTGRLYGAGYHAGRAGLFVVDQQRGLTPYFSSAAQDPWTQYAAGRVLSLGQRLVWVVRDHVDGVFRTRAVLLAGEGRNPVPLFDSSDAAFGAGGWSIGLKQFVLGRDECGRDALFVSGDAGAKTREWTVPLDGGAVSRIDRTLGVVSIPTLGGVLRWSNDGAGGRALQLFTPSGSSQTQLRLAQGSTLFGRAVTASPDRRQIAVNDPDGGTVVMDLALKRAWRLNFDRTYDYAEGAFGGRRLVFNVSQTGDHGLYVQNGIWAFDAAKGELLKVKDSLKVNVGAFANGAVAGWDHSKNLGEVNITWVRSVRFTD